MPNCGVIRWKPTIPECTLCWATGKKARFAAAPAPSTRKGSDKGDDADEVVMAGKTAKGMSLKPFFCF
ncbi:hypothetical protein J21TS3_07770 [Paenibacillus cookii]|uniref:Uncharacterized protein n=1 Tax=Paenibacillus cookii TaxID=157839 RepID=A0ABQ4LT77_9BACL|nr:hypothetical protein J21TS3_07770 [Paenibacillus cookii]